MLRASRLICLVAWLLFAFPGRTLALTNSNNNSRRPIQRVAVIGSGIAGLAVGHALRDDVKEIDVFEGKPNVQPTMGAGLQLSGGLAVLRRYAPKVGKALVEAGIPTQRITSQAIRSNSNDDDDSVVDKLLELDLPATVKANENAQLLMTKDGELQWTNIMRGTLQQVLYDKLPTHVRVQFNKALVEIRQSLDGAVCVFGDGTTLGPYDLIVG